MAVTSVMSSLAAPPTLATARSDWTRTAHLGFLLAAARVDHGLMSMTSLVTLATVYRLGGQYSYFTLKKNGIKMRRIHVNTRVSSE